MDKTGSTIEPDPAQMQIPGNGAQINQLTPQQANIHRHPSHMIAAFRHNSAVRGKEGIGGRRPVPGNDLERLFRFQPDPQAKQKLQQVWIRCERAHSEPPGRIPSGGRWHRQSMPVERTADPVLAYRVYHRA